MAERDRVLVVGEAMIELTHAGDHMLAWTFAGDTLNCAAALAKAAPSLDVHYLTGLGDDDISHEFVGFCAELGVDVGASPVVARRNLGLYWISVQDGERQFRYWRNESAARHVLSSAPSFPRDEPLRAVALSSITLAVAGLAQGALLEEAAAAKRKGALIGYDVNYRATLWESTDAARAVATSAAALCDVVVASSEDVLAVWGDSPEAFCSRMESAGVDEIVVTDGPGPVVALVDGESIAVQPPPATPVDTTGAGDAFFGTYLGSRLSGNAPRRAIEDAVTVASAVVGSAGALGYLRRQ